uniref:Reelin domain-containing protein n=1 Tax=Steinernema glaseri TaxID=37863 RepID=A0A1I8ANB8_9BILA
MRPTRIALLVVTILTKCTHAWFACADDLWPEEIRRRTNHSGSEATRFSIEVREAHSDRQSFVYSRRKEFRIQIVGGPFSWAEIHARSALFPHFVVGEFVNPPPKYFHLRECSRRPRASAVTEPGAQVSRRHGSFLWRAPPTTQAGPLAFVARVVAGGKTFLVQSPILTPSDATLERTACGREYGCASVGPPACSFGNSCELSIRWRCFRDHVLVEASASLANLPYHSTVAFGFTTGRHRAALCTVRPSASQPERVSFREYKLVQRRHGFPTRPKYRNATFLMGERDSTIATCRFEISRPKSGSPSIILGRVDPYGHPIAMRRKRLREKNFCDVSAFPASKKHFSLASLSKLTSRALKTPIYLITAVILLPRVPRLF